MKWLRYTSYLTTSPSLDGRGELLSYIRCEYYVEDTEKKDSSTLTSCCLLQSTTSHISLTKSRSRVSTCGHTDSQSVFFFCTVQSLRDVFFTRVSFLQSSVDVFTDLTFHHVHLSGLDGTPTMSAHLIPTDDDVVLWSLQRSSCAIIIRLKFLWDD